MGASQYGIDVGSLISTQNAFTDQQQRQQLNALAINSGQRTQDYQNALMTAPDDPSRLKVMQQFDPEKALQYRAELSQTDRATHDYQVKLTTDTLGALDTVPDEQLPAAVSSAKAALQAQGLPTAAIDSAVQQSGGDVTALRTNLHQQALNGLGYANQLSEQDKKLDRAEKAKEFDVRQAEVKATNERTAAYRDATLAQGNARLDQGNKRLSVAQQNANTAQARAGVGANAPDPNDPIVQSYVGNILSGNATLQQVPMGKRDAVSVALKDAGPTAYSPLASQRYSRAANNILQNYKALPQFQLTNAAPLYLQRIDAAEKTPGSVSDQDLLDSLTKLNTGGNAVTDAQVKVITDGKSFSDWFGTMANKLKNGGVLSENQRKDIQTIATTIFENYRKGYKPLYDNMTKKLKGAGIPETFWSIPDPDSLVTPQEADAAQGAQGGPPPATAPGKVIDFSALPKRGAK